MKTYRIKELGEIVTGNTPSKKNLDYYISDDIPFFKPDSLDENEITYLKIPREYISFNAKNVARLVPKETILFSCIGSIGKIGITDTENSSFNQQINAIIPNKNVILPKYLCYVLKYNKKKIQSIANAAVVPIINKTQFSEYEISIHTKEEQVKIINILDQAQELIDKRKAQIDALDELIQSVFYDMFGDPITNSKGYKKEELIYISDIITGNTPPRNDVKNYGNFIEWIKSDNINTPYHYITSAEEFLSEKGMKIGRVVDSGAILMTCIAGSLSCIGNVALVDRKIAFNQQINGIIPKPFMSSKFLYVQLLLSKAYLQSSSTNSMKGMVSKGVLSQLKFIVPPIEEQLLFESIFDKVIDHIRLQRESLVELENNFNSLMQRAFNGEPLC